MVTFELLATAILFGGMVLYSFTFAAFVFSVLPMDVARITIRKAFPHFYSFVIVAALATCLLTWPHDSISAAILGLIAVSTVPARQMLMPAINRATDSGATSKFKWLHAASVILTLVHIALAGIVLARFV